MIQINLSVAAEFKTMNEMQEFFKNLSGLTNVEVSTIEKPEPVETKPQPKKETPKKETPKKETPKKETAKKETPKKETAKKETDSGNTPTIEEVRSLLAQKVAKHRAEIKKKLTELGAGNVTSLDKKDYVEFVEFLNSL